MKKSLIKFVKELSQRDSITRNFQKNVKRAKESKCHWCDLGYPIQKAYGEYIHANMFGTYICYNKPTKRKY